MDMPIKTAAVHYTTLPEIESLLDDLLDSVRKPGYDPLLATRKHVSLAQRLTRRVIELKAEVASDRAERVKLQAGLVELHDDFAGFLAALKQAGVLREAPADVPPKETPAVVEVTPADVPPKETPAVVEVTPAAPVTALQRTKKKNGAPEENRTPAPAATPTTEAKP